MSGLTEINNHSLNIDDRNHISMSGAVNVENFDETSITIETTMGDVSLKGSDMHIIKFDTEAGLLELGGEFDSVEYTNTTASKGGFLSRLFG